MQKQRPCDVHNRFSCTQRTINSSLKNGASYFKIFPSSSSVCSTSRGRAGLLPTGLLVADEGLLQLAAGCIHSPHTPLAAASHLLTDTPHFCDQSMQRSVETRHAEQGISVSFPYHLHPCAQQSGERRGPLGGRGAGA